MNLYTFIKCTLFSALQSSLQLIVTRNKLKNTWQICYPYHHQSIQIEIEFVVEVFLYKKNWEINLKSIWRKLNFLMSNLVIHLEYTQFPMQTVGTAMTDKNL